MVNKFFRWLVPKVERWCERTGRFMTITGKQGPEDVYLIRYFVFRTPFFCIYIHRFLRSDIDDPHDHPFDFLGYVVSGSYQEEIFTPYFTGEKHLLMPRNGTRGAGEWAWRRAETIHRVLVDKSRTMSERFDAPLTFIIRGPYRREWQFWRMYKKNPFIGWSVAEPITWHKYLGIKPESRE